MSKTLIIISTKRFVDKNI